MRGIVMEMAPAHTGCFDEAHPTLCYAWSSTGTDAMLMPEGWIGENWYWEIGPSTVSVTPTFGEVPVAAIPEPSIALVLIAGLLLMSFRRFGRSVRRRAE